MHIVFVYYIALGAYAFYHSRKGIHARDTFPRCVYAEMTILIYKTIYRYQKAFNLVLRISDTTRISVYYIISNYIRVDVFNKIRRYLTTTEGYLYYIFAFCWYCVIDTTSYTQDMGKVYLQPCTSRLR